MTVPHGWDAVGGFFLRLAGSRWDAVNGYAPRLEAVGTRLGCGCDVVETRLVVFSHGWKPWGRKPSRSINATVRKYNHN